MTLNKQLILKPHDSYLIREGLKTAALVAMQDAARWRVQFGILDTITPDDRRFGAQTIAEAERNASEMSELINRANNAPYIDTATY